MTEDESSKACKEPGGCNISVLANRVPSQPDGSAQENKSTMHKAFDVMVMVSSSGVSFNQSPVKKAYLELQNKLALNMKYMMGIDGVPQDAGLSGSSLALPKTNMSTACGGI